MSALTTSGGGAIGDHDIGAVPREPGRQRAPYPHGAAGDKRNLSAMGAILHGLIRAAVRRLNFITRQRLSTRVTKVSGKRTKPRLWLPLALLRPTPSDTLSSAQQAEVGMDFGVFDHLDRTGADLPGQYARRLELAALYDQLGFYAYHLAEHHSTPLGLSPSPSVFLSSVIQRTRCLRVGPLVYLLPLYHPLRLLEEICMLDNLSNGRMQLGVGRGISPIELGYYGQTSDQAKDVYEENLRILLAGFANEMLTYEGRFSTFEKVPMSIRPVQQPHPPIWMGISSEESAAFAGKAGYNIVALMPGAAMRSRVEAYRAARGNGPMGKVGISYLVVVGDDDNSAMSAASAAYTTWHRSFHYLYRLHGRQPVQRAWPKTFAGLVEAERAIAGSPQTVIDFMRRQVDASGINYIVSQLMFGDLPHETAKRSIELYAREVIPGLRN